MVRKPTYEKLAQRVKELEKEIEREKTKELRQSEKELREAKRIPEGRLETVLLPGKNPASLEITNIVEIEILTILNEEFANIFDVCLLLTDANGKYITGPTNLCEFCQLVRSTEKGLERCKASDTVLAKKALRAKRPVITRCSNAGFIDAVVPIYIGTRHIASWLVGQFCPSEVDEKRVRQCALEIGADEHELLAAYRRMKSRPAEKMESVLKLLAVTVQYLSEYGLNNLILIREITLRKQTGKALRESLIQKQALLNGSSDTIMQIDTNMKVLWANKTALDMNPDIVGNTCYKSYPGRDNPCEGCPCKRAIKTGNTESGVMHQPVVEGVQGESYWENIGVPLKDDAGEIVGAIEIGRNVTERKQTEEALWKSEKKYRTLLETTSEGWWLLNSEHKTIEINQSLCNMLGYSEKEILGKTPFDFVDDENRKVFVEQTSKIPTTHHRSYEITLKKKNGEDLRAHFNASTIRDESGDVQGSFALITDITERKQTQKERDRLVIAIEQVAESVFITDRDGVIQYVNPAFERLTGYSRKDVIGQNPRILKSGKHDTFFYKEMWNTLIRGDAWHGRFINKKKDGSLYEAEATISPILDEQGKITNFMSIKRDVTHEIKLEKQLVQAQKMEAIGTLAGGIAHDFNNILSAIMGYSELALIEVPKEKKLYDNVQKVLYASHRAKDLVQQILTFSRKSEEKKAPVQISHLVKEALKFLRSSIPTTIEIREKIAGEIGIINANPTQMYQVIMNLCTNASYAMQKGGGILEVSLKNIDLDSHSAVQYPDIDPGKYLRLTVSDTGKGIAPEIIERIFEPYFTTKEKGVGTGMGLSIVHGIVKDHGGMVTVYSEPGKGSTFYVYIPLIQEEVKRPEIDEDAPIPTGTEHILFIDDEPALADLGKQMLERLGYEVTSRTSSVKALELFKAQPDRFDLVVTDMTMPNMTGDRLARELMKIRPDIPVIICTGYSERITEEKTKRIGIKALVMKPYVMKDLASIVRKVIDT
jgi:PAS domain S-box-containing protein